MKEYYGAYTEIREELAGHISPLNSRRAEEAFGYRQRYIWSASQRYLEM